MPFYDKWTDLYYEDNWDGWYCSMSANHIVLTQEFMNKYMKYAFELDDGNTNIYIAIWLLDNLNNTVDYLYNLINNDNS
jgi:hypothetical protein